MSLSNVASISSLEDLKRALGSYCRQGREAAEGFAVLLSRKLKELEGYDSQFRRRLEAAENQLRSCEWARSLDPPDSRRSCVYYERAYHDAQVRYSRYKSEIQGLRASRSLYEQLENKYSNSLCEIERSSMPELNRVIGLLSDYSASDEPAVNVGSIGAGTLASPGVVAAPPAQDSISDANVGDDEVLPSGFTELAVAGIATAMLGAYLMRRGTANNSMALDESFIDNAFYEKFGFTKAAILLMPSPQREQYIERYNELCQGVEGEAKKQYRNRLEEEKESKNQYEYAVLAGHVYKPETTLPEAEWSVVSTTDDPNLNELILKINEFNTDGSGFYAQLYKNDSTGEYILAFKGSDAPKSEFKLFDFVNPVSLGTGIVTGRIDLNDSKDWIWTNVAQGLGFPNKQYINAQGLGRIMADLRDKNGYNFTTVGHSLGGGLASVASLESGCQAFTYNQAELTHRTVKELGLESEITNHRIIAYHDPNEELIKGQDIVNEIADHLSSETLGRNLNKSDVNFTKDIIEAHERDTARRMSKDKETGNYFLRLGYSEIDSKGNHGIDDVISYFESKYSVSIGSETFGYSDIVSDKTFENSFKINGISENPVPESQNIENFANALRQAGVVGVMSKK